jgi:hypothetical protein
VQRFDLFDLYQTNGTTLSNQLVTTMADDFILTLDSDSEPETSSRPSSSKRTSNKSNSKPAPSNKNVNGTGKKEEENEEFALDDEFALDFSGLDGARTALRETLGDGVDFWEEGDEVKGGKLVRTTLFLVLFCVIRDVITSSIVCYELEAGLTNTVCCILYGAMWMILVATLERRRYHRT